MSERLFRSEISPPITFTRGLQAHLTIIDVVLLASRVTRLGELSPLGPDFGCVVIVLFLQNYRISPNNFGLHSSWSNLCSNFGNKTVWATLWAIFSQHQNGSATLWSIFSHHPVTLERRVVITAARVCSCLFFGSLAKILFLKQTNSYL
jgi:hypothetical protein